MSEQDPMSGVVVAGAVLCTLVAVSIAIVCFGYVTSDLEWSRKKAEHKQQADTILNDYKRLNGIE